MADSKLIIAMFGHKRIPSREGGVEIVVEELATRMVGRGHEVTCFNRRKRYRFKERIESSCECKNDLKSHKKSCNKSKRTIKTKYKGIELKTVFTIDKKGLAATTSSFFAAWKAVWGKYDIVHIHAEGPAAMCWLPKRSGKKVVVTIHGLDWARAKWGSLASKYIKWGEKQAVKHADAIIVLSCNMKEYFLKEYGRKTIYIPNGITKSDVCDADIITKKWELNKDSYVLFVGRLVPEKGLDYLIKAWKNIKTDKKLVIVGDGSDTNEYTDGIKSKASENIIFTGFQQGKALKELYSNAYLYCLPSDVEGMPLTLLEAMSYGNCCLVSDIPECTEVVEDKAVVFTRGKTKELQERLQELIDNPLKVEGYKSESTDFILSKYNWDRVVDSTLKVYKGL